jgi:signal transduction histidine kinase
VSPRLRAVLRAILIAAGAAVTLASVVTFRSEDWPIYAAFVVLSIALFQPWVEVLPGLGMPMPTLALTIGFLYIAGPPIIVLRVATPLALRLLRTVLPERWKPWVPEMIGGAGELVAGRMAGRPVREFDVVAAEWAVFAIGLGVRWGIAAYLIPEGRPSSSPLAILLGEIGGYAWWGMLAALPLYSFRPWPAAHAEARLHPVLIDLGHITALVTAFVFLIAYGWEAHGLVGASAWACASLFLHFLLKSLHERWLLVEEQNQSLAALNRELEHRERLSAIGKMSSVISHQMLQQLGVIGLYADLIRRAEPGDDGATVDGQAKAYAVAIEEALGEVNRVLRDLLVFSRDLRVNLYPHRLRDVLAECVEECRPAAAARGVALRLDCAGDPILPLDKLKVKQALANVVRNAVEASATGDEVAVRAAARDGWAEVAVSDRGPGIPERDREAIFTPFFTTREHGTGLGLAIAREFVRAHGGTLGVDGSVARGATVVLRLPVDGR